mmetsp:Transcript_19010/g.38525  ORF Transcript_19010/g.38525 Transcript_19010/m.38525 type:complete len:211 (-) Transcript_19010:576-1208(-)
MDPPPDGGASPASTHVPASRYERDRPNTLSRAVGGGKDPSGATRRTVRTRRFRRTLRRGDDADVVFEKNRSVVRRTQSAMGRRSDWYVERRCRSSGSSDWSLPPPTPPSPLLLARRSMTAASFHARLAASCSPVFIPCAPAGLWQCAASPARWTLPPGLLYRDTSRQLTLYRFGLSNFSISQRNPPGILLFHLARRNSSVQSAGSIFAQQ